MSSRFFLDGHAFDAPPLAPGLHVVATPIGNLADITLRALRTLAGAEAILVEDSRVTRTLLTHYGISRPMFAYHEHNGQAQIPHVLERLAQGQALALVSDAGTPLVSDPGYRLIEAALAAGFAVSPIPGPSAALAALVISDLPTDRFFFEGFLPARQGERKRRLRELAGIPATLVIYEAPHRLIETLADMVDVLGERRATVARELTKRFETAQRGALPALLHHYRDTEAPRGEIVILIGAGDETTTVLDDAAIDRNIVAALQTHSPRDAATVVAAALGLPRRQVYARIAAMNAARPDDGR